MENNFGKNIKRITCFLPKGVGIRLVERLHVEKKIDSINVNSGRGLHTAESVKDSGAWSEHDILTVVLDAERAEEIFEFIFFQGELNNPGGGFIYLSTLIQASHYTLPSIEG